MFNYSSFNDDDTSSNNVCIAPKKKRFVIKELEVTRMEAVIADLMHCLGTAWMDCGKNKNKITLIIWLRCFTGSLFDSK